MCSFAFLLLAPACLLLLGCYGCEEGDIRLADGYSNSSGRVEFCHGGEWGTVCDDDWGVEDAQVVCRQLGLPTNATLALLSFGGGSGAILLDNVQCSGMEERLEDCSHHGIGVHDCAHSEDAGVICDYGNNYVCEEGDIRLAGGSDPNSSGRVDFCHGGVWGTVCDDGWGSDEARVVCRQLGLPTDVTLPLLFFGGGHDNTFLANVACSGLEEQLEHCNHSGIGLHDCGYMEEAGVTCGIGQDSGKRCDYQNSESELTREELERFGNCVPYQAPSQSFLCDDLYTPGVDYIYVSYQRTAGDLGRFLDILTLNAGLLSAIFQDECYYPAIHILCHYYLPPCGNSTTFEPPTSLCMEACNYLQEICPNEWNDVVSHFEDNASRLSPYGATFINCSNTGEYLDPLPYCCSDVGLNISCTDIGSAGELVPDSSCLNFTASDISVQPSPSIRVSSQQTLESVAIILGPVCAAVVILLLMVIGAFVWVLIRKYRRREKKKQEISEPQSFASLDYRLDLLHGRDISPCYHGNENLPQAPPPPVLPRRARVNSGFIRQMSKVKLLIPERNLHLQDCVGQGEFGIVYRATLSGWSGKGQEIVAVKTLKGVFSASDLNSLVEESLKMSKFNHPNVMRLVGVCIDGGDSPYIVMPFMIYGSLLSYLRKHRAELTIANDDNMELVNTARKKLLSMCLQISKGMSYLANEKFVHRDLAARNCMIDNNFVIKVSDFGLSENVYAKNYFRQLKLGEEGGDQVKLPVRWMALESLNDGLFSEKTDVWSFGVMCWEVFSLGKTPYPGVDPFALIKYLERGERLEKPNNAACSEEVYDIMKKCWREQSDKRPTFSDLVATISISLEAIAGYLDFTATLTPTENFENESDHLTVTAGEEDGSQKLDHSLN